MNTRENCVKKSKLSQQRKNPSFSSTLLDEMYRSIDESDKKPDISTMKKKQNNGGLKSTRATEEDDVSRPSLHRARLIEQYMKKKESEKMVSQKRQISQEFDIKTQYYNDPLFFSSSSCSSDSSSGGFSSSEFEFSGRLQGKASSCLAPAMPIPKPIRTSVSEKRTEKKIETLPKKQSRFNGVDDCHYNSAPEFTTNSENRDGSIKSKLKGLKIYNDLKKTKQPISPGARLSMFINSIFSSKKSKKNKNSTSNESFDEMGTAKTSNSRTCSSATSFSRSCLSKNSFSTRENLQSDGMKRTVRFSPVNIIVDPSSQIRNSKEKSHPNSQKIMNLAKFSREEELKFQLIEKKWREEEAAMDVLKHYRRTNEKKQGSSNAESYANHEVFYDNDEEDEDAESDSSSDLFELDHLKLTGKNYRYCEELPVYETTHVITNRAIANGLIL